MIRAKDYRHIAWNKLHGKWGTMAGATFLLALFMGICSALSIIFIGGIATLLLSGAFTLGMATLTLDTARMQKVKIDYLFRGFKNYGASFLLNLLCLLFIFLWTLLLIIPGIIKVYSYSMSFFILADEPDLPANQARKKSMQIMRGNKWRLFCLDLSFIGWWLLGILTLGILFFWIIPYRNTAHAEFYLSLNQPCSTPNTQSEVCTDNEI